MTYLEIREKLVTAIDATCGSLNDPRFAKKLADSQSDVVFEELELDSLTAVEFCVEVENSTSIEVDPGDLITYPSINALAAFLSSKNECR